MTHHDYPGVSKDQALAAIEKLFRLSDEDHYTLAHNENGFQATRRWGFYAVLIAGFGTDLWEVKTTPIENGLKIAVQVNTQAGSVGPLATSNGGWTAGVTGLSGFPVNGNAAYDLFWRRLDYLLGKTDHWITCPEARDRFLTVKNGLWGSLDPFCLAAKDNHPDPANDDRAKFALTD